MPQLTQLKKKGTITITKMGTTSFIIYLTIGYFITKEVIPKSTTQIWLLSILTPILLLLLTTLIFGSLNSYYSGLVVGQCAISTIATMILMIVRFLNKLSKNKTDEIE